MSYIDRIDGDRQDRHLVNWVDSRKLAEHGNSEDLRDQVSAQKMSDSLVDMEISGAHPYLCEQPVIFSITREKYGIVLTRGLMQLPGGSI